ncbi:hypothetical protein PLICRDRAFT_43682 [Plicaturopsis crispa FD-325 SS-3]|nr:hypothetical protein PLICRDRAFT_43682 [Plicaturopsis crispa FD-325 SS-3]
MDLVPEKHGIAADHAPLPPELISLILDIAAASSRSTALALCLVSSWTRKLARPYLLEAAILSTQRQTKAFGNLVVHAEGAAESRAMVRHMWSSLDFGMELAFGHLPALADVAINASHLFYSAYAEGPCDVPIPSTRDLRLTLLPAKRTTFSLDRLKALEHTNCALLGRTTHLSYAMFADNMGISEVLLPAVELLPRFPRLTHLAMALPTAPCPWHSVFETFCTDALTFPSLEVLVLVLTASARASYPDEDMAFLASLRERFPRVCIVDVDDSLGDVSAEAWMEEVRTGNSIWERAARCGARKTTH